MANIIVHLTGKEKQLLDKLYRIRKKEVAVYLDTGVAGMARELLTNAMNEVLENIADERKAPRQP